MGHFTQLTLKSGHFYTTGRRQLGHFYTSGEAIGTLLHNREKQLGHFYTQGEATGTLLHIWEA